MAPSSRPERRWITRRKFLTLTIGAGGLLLGLKVRAKTRDKPPIVSGPSSPAVGDILNTTNGQWSGTPTGYTYQWRRCDSGGASCSDIGGATSNAYTLVTADNGSTIRSAVTAAYSGHPSATQYSAPTNVVGIPVPAAIAGLGYSLVFNEDFSNFSYNNNGSIVDSATWQRPFSGANDSGTVFVDGNGVLNLQYTVATATKPIEVATRKSTNNFTNSFVYGYFEASIKCPSNPLSAVADTGPYPQWWMAALTNAWGETCTNTAYGNPTLNPEIDLIEGGYGQGVPGWSGGPTWTTTVHNNTGSGCSVTNAPVTRTEAQSGFSSAFHTVGCWWQPSGVSFYLDNVLLHAQETSPALSVQPLFLVLGTAVHAGYTDTLPSSFTTYFDWVRAWQNPPRNS